MKNNNEQPFIEIGERIKKRRKELKLAQKELASLSNVGETTVRTLEKGEHKPTEATLSKIAKALKVDYDYLRYGTQKKCDVFQIPTLDKNFNEYETAPIWKKLLPKFECHVVGLEEEFKKSLRIVEVDDHVYFVSKFSDDFLNSCSTNKEIFKKLKGKSGMIYKKNQKMFLPINVFEDGVIRSLGDKGCDNYDLASLLNSESEDFIIGQIQ